MNYLKYSLIAALMSAFVVQSTSAQCIWASEGRVEAACFVPEEPNDLEEDPSSKPNAKLAAEALLRVDDLGDAKARFITGLAIRKGNVKRLTDAPKSSLKYLKKTTLCIELWDGMTEYATFSGGFATDEDTGGFIIDGAEGEPLFFKKTKGNPSKLAVWEILLRVEEGAVDKEEFEASWLNSNYELCNMPGMPAIKDGHTIKMELYYKKGTYDEELLWQKSFDFED